MRYGTAIAILLLLAGCAGNGSDRAPTRTPTVVPTATATVLPTATATQPPSATATVAPSHTATAAPTHTSLPTTTATAIDNATATLTPTATATVDDELPPALDNGADGRNPFNDPNDVRPIDACTDTLHASDESLVLRILPRGPIVGYGGLAFTSGACVYLPPGYLESGLEYPVIYLLHGGGGDQADWIVSGQVPAIMDAAIAADPSAAAIVVTPDGTDGQWYDNIDGSLLNQRYVLDYLIPYVDRHFRTIASRAGRAIDGLSNGGYGALHLAAKAPDRFVAAGSMSGNLAALSFAGLAAGTAPAFAHGSLPVDLASNLDGVDVTMDIGTECIGDHAIDNCLAYQFEQIFVPANRDFVTRLEDVRGVRDGVFEYREGEGAHAWRWWSPWLRDRHLPFLLARLADPRPSDTPEREPTPRFNFRYRSVAPSFSVWGYQVDMHRDVREFVDLREVTSDGFEIQGSGQATVRTAPIYGTGARYRVAVSGLPDQVLIPGLDQRLTIHIDLGPSHTFEQFTPQANAAEAAGRYWTVRTVTIPPGRIE